MMCRLLRILLLAAALSGITALDRPEVSMAQESTPSPGGTDTEMVLRQAVAAVNTIMQQPVTMLIWTPSLLRISSITLPSACRPLASHTQPTARASGSSGVSCTSVSSRTPGCTIEDVIVDGDRGVVRFTLHGHPDPSRFGRPGGATDAVSISGAFIGRVADGQVAEGWIYIDESEFADPFLFITPEPGLFITPDPNAPTFSPPPTPTPEPACVMHG